MNQNANQLVVAMGSECLATNVDYIRDKIYSRFADGITDICLDFSDTLYIDAAGVGVIAAAVFEGRRRGCNITMKGAKGSVLDMLTSTGLYRVDSWSGDNLGV